ncbi:hypothetical protein CLU81_0197 [Flavobacterium sp. 9]|nr:hypothetical protein CLU81_0197 [Flavobacterium sp. 9]
MDQYSGKYFTQNHSITSTANSQSGKNAIQLMDNRPVSALQQKLSGLATKSRTNFLRPMLHFLFYKILVPFL